MNFIIYENALPVLEEYQPEEALRILLSKHSDEFPEEIIECNTLAAKMCLENIEDPGLLYACYVTSVAQTRWLGEYYANQIDQLI